MIRPQPAPPPTPPRSLRPRRRTTYVLIALVLVAAVVLGVLRWGAGGAAPRWAGPGPGPLHVAGRTLADKDGTTAIWVADTAWNLVSLTREDVDRYLDARARQGFTVIQFSPVFLEKEHDANGYGDRPFDGDVAHLTTTAGTDPASADQYDYWDHVDYIVGAIKARGMTAAMVAIWSTNHAGTSVTADTAEGYGRFLGNRYGGDGVVYALGGDDEEPHEDIWAPMADGLRDGATSPVDARTDVGVRTTSDRPLLTYHPVGLHPPDYGYTDVDFAMIQTGHCIREGYPNLLAETARLLGGTPFLDAEPLYEEHPVCWKPEEYGYSTAGQVRRAAYWGLFAGGFGVAYGHHAVWQFNVPGKTRAAASPRQSWQEALNAPGAQAMAHVAGLVRSRPMESRVADDAILADGVGSGWERRSAMRDGRGRWAMAYLPSAKPVRLKLDAIAGNRVKISWFDPHSGTVTEAGERAKGEVGTLTPPQRPAVAEDSPDWVLIVDRA